MRRQVETFLDVARHVRRLFHQLRALSEAAYDYEPGFTAAHRAVLESLYATGPATVPALARMRPVARQHVQVLVNELEAQDLVVARPNPAHKRSPLIALTAAGKKRFETLHRVERAFVSGLKLPLSDRELARVAKDLGALSEGLAEVLAQGAARNG